MQFVTVLLLNTSQESIIFFTLVSLIILCSLSPFQCHYVTYCNHVKPYGLNGLAHDIGMAIAISFLWGAAVVIGCSGSTVVTLELSSYSGCVFRPWARCFPLQLLYLVAPICAIALVNLISLIFGWHCLGQTRIVLWLLLDNFETFLSSLLTTYADITQSVSVHLLSPDTASHMSPRFLLLSVPILLQFL